MSGPTPPSRALLSLTLPFFPLPFSLLLLHALTLSSFLPPHPFFSFFSSCRIGNIQTAFALLEEVWQRNEAGEKWVNWAAISREKGWNVSFA